MHEDQKKRAWEDWQLTAYAVGELEPQLAREIAAAAQLDPKLLAEIDAIQATLELVSASYQAETGHGLGDQQLGEILKHTELHPHESAEVAGAGGSIELASSAAKRSGVWHRRRLLLGSGVAAAALLVTGYFWYPQQLGVVVGLAKYSPPATNTTASQSSDESASLSLRESGLQDAAEESGLQDGQAEKESAAHVAADQPASGPGGSVADDQSLESLLQPDASGRFRDLASSRGSVPSKNEELSKQGAAEGAQSGGYGSDQSSSAPGVDAAASITRDFEATTSQDGLGTAMKTVERAGVPIPADAFDGGYGGGAGPDPGGAAGAGGYGGAAPSSGGAAGAGGYGAGPDGSDRGGQPASESSRGKKSSEVTPHFFAPTPAQSASNASPAAVVVPEGGTILLRGIRRSRDTSGGSDEFMQTLTPRIIIQEEEEELYGQEGSLRGGVVAKHESLDVLSRRTRTADKFERFNENPFAQTATAPLSTLSIDVDTAAFSKCRQLLLENRTLPPAAAVRLEEFINYFDYEYAGPQGEDPFSSELAVSSCPWKPEHRLVRIALQAKKVETEQRPPANIVFLLDVSGSMNADNKLPLVKESMRMLIKQLGESDRVAMAVYAGAAGCVLEGTTGDQQDTILGALESLNAGGSTNGGQGIQLAYNLARENFVPGGVNRVILCTDGDFNVGVTSTNALVDLVAENAKSKIFLTVLGFGMGNTNDAMMEQISNSGDGVYGFVDTRREAHRQMVEQLSGNLVTVAKDVKIQVEFNPTKVQAYRLLGYENRVMANEDFNDDTKDAGEIGAGHRVTALYEIVPVGVESDVNRPKVDPLRYRVAAEPEDPAPESAVATEEAESEFADELLAVKLRYKQPEGTVSKLLVFPLADRDNKFTEADRDFQWAACMVQFGMMLRNSQFRGTTTWESLLEQASSAAGISPDESRQECLTMIRTAAQLSGH